MADSVILKTHQPLPIPEKVFLVLSLEWGTGLWRLLSYYFLPPAFVGLTYDAGSLGCSHSSAIQDGPKPLRNKTRPTALRRVVMCLSFPRGRVSVVQNKPSRPTKPASYLHCSFCRLAFCTPASLIAPCYKRLFCSLTAWSPYWPPYFVCWPNPHTACQFSPSQPADRCSSLSTASFVLNQHQHDATPSAPLLQFRARRAASRGPNSQIPQAKTMHSSTFMQSSHIMQSLLCEFPEFPSSSLAGLNSRIRAVSKLPLVVLLQLPFDVQQCSAVLQ